MRYAILGGSFDPIHRGHLELADACREQLELDDVVLIPSNQNPIKGKPWTSASDRMHMCRLACEGHPGVVVSDIEIQRGGRSFTIETLEDFSMARPGEIWLILGSDALMSFEKWRKPLRIAQLARLAVVERESAPLEKVFARLPEDVRYAIDVVSMKPNRCSSSLVRELILREESAEMWLHPKVWEYISERGLYKQR